MARTFSFYLAAPGDGTSLLEVVDVKDVAEFLMLAIDRSLFGAFNLAARPMSFRDFLSGCKSATHSDAEFVWIPESFLREQGLVTTQIRQRMVFPKSAAKKPTTQIGRQDPSMILRSITSFTLPRARILSFAIPCRPKNKTRSLSPGESAKTRTSLIGASQRRRSPAGKNPPRQMLVRSGS